tara:strand:+ start:4084 stop:4452 length:369 start_codon:yes stop_codon:yes gene_type:complete
LQITKKQEEEIQKIKDFLIENGITLDLSLKNENYIDHDESKIVVYLGQPHKHIVYTALHEIGHYFNDLSFDEDTHAATVIGEVLAWDLGMDIAASIGLDIDHTVWNKLMIDCVGKYIKYPNN